MPQSLSANKRVRQDEKLRLRNRAVKSAVKTQIRKFLGALEAGDAEAAAAEYRAAARALDKAASKGTLHKRTVARRKSRLAAKLNALSAPANPS